MTSQKPFQIIYNLHNQPVSEEIKFDCQEIRTETINFHSDSDDDVQIISDACEEVSVNFDDKFEVTLEDESQKFFQVDDESPFKDVEMPKIANIDSLGSKRVSGRGFADFHGQKWMKLSNRSCNDVNLCGRTQNGPVGSSNILTGSSKVLTGSSNVLTGSFKSTPINIKSHLKNSPLKSDLHQPKNDETFSATARNLKLARSSLKNKLITCKKTIQTQLNEQNAIKPLSYMIISTENLPKVPSDVQASIVAPLQCPTESQNGNSWKFSAEIKPSKSQAGFVMIKKALRKDTRGKVYF